MAVASDGAVAGAIASLTIEEQVRLPLTRKIIDWLVILPGSTILDAGCGRGETTGLLAAATGSTGQVAALDAQSANLAATRHHLEQTPYAGQVTYHQSELEALPFVEESFDLIWSSKVLHNVPDPVAQARELVRVGRRGGRVVLSEPAITHQLIPSYLAVGPSGFASRLEALRRTHADDKRRRSQASTSYMHSPGQLLHDVGCLVVIVRTFPFDLLPPFEEAQRTYLQGQLSELRDNTTIRAQLNEADRAALDTIADPMSPDYLLNRPDIHYISSTTVYIGRVRQ